jgi:hypothetical protein
MEVYISYNEVLRFIRSHANVDVSRLQIVPKSSRTLAISYDISDWVPTVTISVSVDKVTEHHLYLSYDCSAAASMIISGVVSFLQSKIPAGVKVDTTSKKVYVYLDVINGLEKALQYVTPKDIQFETNVIHVSAELK